MDHDKRAVSQPMPDEKPVSSTAAPTFWGSDAVAAMLRELDIPYVALNPGASYPRPARQPGQPSRQQRPQMLLCLHEEHAVGDRARLLPRSPGGRWPPSCTAMSG